MEDVTFDANSQKKFKECLADEQDDEKDEHEEFVIEKIVRHHVNKSHKHQHNVYGDNLYHIHCYECKHSEDIWEPIADITLSNITSYYNCRKINLPIYLDKAIDV